MANPDAHQTYGRQTHGLLTYGLLRERERLLAQNAKALENTLVGALGMRFLPVELAGEMGADAPVDPLLLRVCALMDVDGRTCQPFGYLSGGASLALAETLAGYASMLLLAPGLVPVGAQVSANHVHALAVGETVRASARLVHLGRSTHVWNVDITREAGAVETPELVSTARVLNHLGPIKA